MPRIEINSLDDERLYPYRQLKGNNRVQWAGRFIAEGLRVVERLLQSDFQTESVLVSERREEKIADQVPNHVPLYVLPQQLTEILVGFNFHTGIVACGLRRPAPKLRDVANGAPGSLIMVCPNIHDPDNLGQIIRLSSAFGASAVAVGPGSADPFSRRVLRVSMGYALLLPVVQSENLLDEVRELQREGGYHLTATVLDEQAIPLHRFQRPERLAVLLGNEAWGLEPEWVDLCDHRITIPMRQGTDSLNVAMSAAIFLYYLTLE